MNIDQGINYSELVNTKGEVIRDQAKNSTAENCGSVTRLQALLKGSNRSPLLDANRVLVGLLSHKSRKRLRVSVVRRLRIDYWLTDTQVRSVHRPQSMSKCFFLCHSVWQLRNSLVEKHTHTYMYMYVHTYSHRPIHHI